MTNKEKFKEVFGFEVASGALKPIDCPDDCEYLIDGKCYDDCDEWWDEEYKEVKDV